MVVGTPRTEGAGAGRARGLLAAWMLLPLLASACSRELWAPDEPRYAEVARELVERGDWLVMHLCGAVYPDKPPLLYWLAGLFGAAGGWSEAWMRAPSLLASAGSAALVAGLARRWWGAREALWAPALYLGTAMVTEIGGRLQIDPLLACLVLAGLFVGSRPRGGAGALLGAGALFGLAALAKGPVAWLHGWTALLLWAWVDRGDAARPRRRAGAWVGAALLSVLPVAAWALLAAAREPVLADQLLFRQHVGRLGGRTDHVGPVWEHALHLPLLLLPWTAPVVAGLVAAGRELRARRRGAAFDAGAVRALVWFAPILLAFSLIPPKRDLYLLPVYPALALLGARALAGALERGRLPRWIAWPGPAVLALVGLGVTAAGPFLDVLPGLWWRAPLVGLPLLIGGVVALRASSGAADVRRWGVAQLAGWCAGATAAGLFVFPPINAEKSAREVALVLAARPERPRAIPCVGVQPEGYRFYGGVPTVRDGEGELDALYASEGAEFLALYRRQAFDRLAPEERARFRVLHEQQVGHRSVLVLGAADASARDGEARVRPVSSARATEEDT